MKKYKYFLIVIGCFFLFGLAVGLNEWYKPHINVQEMPAFETIAVNDFVQLGIADRSGFNEKYLSQDGDSKIIIIEGIIADISTNMNQETVVFVKGALQDEVGVMCTFVSENETKPEKNNLVKIKGIVRSGAEYDDDLELYVDAVLEKSKIVSE